MGTFSVLDSFGLCVCPHFLHQVQGGRVDSLQLNQALLQPQAFGNMLGIERGDSLSLTAGSVCVIEKEAPAPCRDSCSVRVESCCHRFPRIDAGHLFDIGCLEALC